MAQLSTKNVRGPTRSRAPAATEIKKQTIAESHMAQLSAKNRHGPTRSRVEIKKTDLHRAAHGSALGEEQMRAHTQSCPGATEI
jgi:hypothetical protein